jgi:hypothetical protein
MHTLRPIVIKVTLTFIVFGITLAMSGFGEYAELLD